MLYVGKLGTKLPAFEWLARPIYLKYFGRPYDGNGSYGMYRSRAEAEYAAQIGSRSLVESMCELSSGVCSSDLLRCPDIAFVGVYSDGALGVSCHTHSLLVWSGDETRGYYALCRKTGDKITRV